MNRIKQIIRIIDVFYIGLLLIWVAVRFSMPQIVKVQLIITGIATILYNGYNFYIEFQKEQLLQKNKNRIIQLADLTVGEQNLRTKLKQNYNLKLTY